VDSSFERFCLTAGIGAIEQMLCGDARRLAGALHSRGGGRVGHRWGMTKGKIGFHGGKVVVQRPRVRSYDGHEVELPTWTAAQAEDWLARWAMNLMLINVSTFWPAATRRRASDGPDARNLNVLRARVRALWGLSDWRGNERIGLSTGPKTSARRGGSRPGE
jgi:putative transposase